MTCQQENNSAFKSPYISELNLANLSQSVNDLAAYLVRNIQLNHTHVRRAKHGILRGSHSGDKLQLPRPQTKMLERLLRVLG